MRVTAVLLGCAACLLFSQPGVARIINKVTIAVSKPGMTVDRVESDRLNCIPTSTEVNYATRAFIRCMELKGYTVNPEGYRLTLVIREPRRSMSRMEPGDYPGARVPPLFVNVQRE